MIPDPFFPGRVKESMSSLLKQLDDQAALLMYLANELPPQDRARLEERLAGEPALRQELVQLTSLQNAFGQQMRPLDQAAGPSEAAATERARRAIGQWQIKRLAEPATESGSQGYPWWVPTLAAVAAVVIASMVWWASLAPVPPPQPYVMSGSGWAPEGRWRRMLASTQPTTDPSDLADIEAAEFTGLVGTFTHHDDLQKAEQEALALENTPTWDLFDEP